MKFMEGRRFPQISAAHWNAPFLGFSVILLYAYVFQATKPSPLMHASVGDHALIVAQLLGVAATLALAHAGVSCLMRRFLGRAGHIMLRIAAIAVLATFVAVVAENFMYTLFGKGLKNTDSILLRILVGYGAVRAAMDLSLLPAKWAPALRNGGLVVPLLALASLLHVGWGFAVANHPDTAKPTIDRLPNVVILSADGVEANHMSAYGYARDTTPFLKSKASEFAIFDNAYTNNEKTTGSIVSLLTGTSSMENGVAFPPDMLRGKQSLRSLPNILRRLGYYSSNWAVPYYFSARIQNMVSAFDRDNGSKIFVHTTQLLPGTHELSRWIIADTLSGLTDMASGIVLMRPFGGPFDLSSGRASYAQDDNNLDGILNDISKKKGNPYFINTHFMMTHGPGFLVKEPHFSHGEQKIAWADDFYDDAIKNFDGLVEIVWSHIEKAGNLDNTIIIITSDHGRRWDSMARLPLMIRFPDRRMASRHGGVVQRLDVAPTVLEYIGYPVPEWMGGRSLLDWRDDCGRIIASYGVLGQEQGAGPSLWVNHGSIAKFDAHVINIVKDGYGFSINSEMLSAANRNESELSKLITVRQLDGSCQGNVAPSPETIVSHIMSLLAAAGQESFQLQASHTASQ